MTFTSYDDVTASLIPSDATHCSYYATGRYANLGAIQRQCPHAKLMPVLTVPGDIPPFDQIVGSEHGVSIDIENTDWTPADAGPFAQKCVAAGIMPVFYCSLSMAGEVLASLHAAGIPRDHFKLHTAHWTGQPHICTGIASAYGTVDADATQYTDQALGRSLDASLCKDNYFSGLGRAPQRKQKHPSGVMNANVSIDWSKPPGHKGSIRGTKGTWKAGTDQPLEVFQISVDRHGVWRIAPIPNDTPPLGHK